jgi:hypothetical protein
MKIPKKINCDVVSEAQPTPVSQAHPFSKFSTYHITCIPIATGWSFREAQVTSKLFKTRASTKNFSGKNKWREKARNVVCNVWFVPFELATSLLQICAPRSRPCIRAGLSKARRTCSGPFILRSTSIITSFCSLSNLKTFRLSHHPTVLKAAKFFQKHRFSFL